MKALVIDSSLKRQKMLEAKLANKGVIASCITTLNVARDRQSIQQADVVILLDQDYSTAKQMVENAINNKAQVLLTNMAEINQSYCDNYIIFFTDKSESEESLTSQIDTIFQGFSKPYFMPIAVDPTMRATLEIAKKAAKSKVSVLINGETGVGKEVLAQYIHHHSPYSEGPFVAVNCAALPENMVEALLFGHEKGSFTGAINTHIGKFEQANHGTLLLDEISELPLLMQAKLLRVLQEREVERLGSKKQIKIDVRIIAATNLDLHQQVLAGAFRKDLYYRLNVIPVHCAPLRDRPLDIIPLAEYFIKRYAMDWGRKIPTLSETAKRKLMNSNWNGNIREMENVIQRAIIMMEGEVINGDDIHLEDEFIETTTKNNVIQSLDRFSSKFEAGEAKIIIDVLNETKGCRNTAAQRLNISPRTLRYKIAKLKTIGLDLP